MKGYSKVADFFKQEYLNLVKYVHRWVDRLTDLDAEDIVQEVMVSLFDRADVTIPIDNLAAYVHGSLRNKIIDTYRRRKDIVSLDDKGANQDIQYLAGVITDVEKDIVTETEKSELTGQLYNAIDSLNDRDRAIVIATELEGRSFRQLSEQWGESVGTLLARKSRALKKIKKMLSNWKN